MFDIEVYAGQFETELARVASLASEVSNTANNKGFAYYWAVDKGRGPIRPVNAKALRFFARDGQVVFAKSAKSAPAQHLTEQSLANLMPNAIMAVNQAHGNSFLSWARTFLRSLANFQAQSLAKVTPRVSGRLARNYKVNVNG